MGQLVLLQELMRRLNQRGDAATVFWAPKIRDKAVEEVIQEAEVTCETLEEVCTVVASLREDRDVLLGADREVVLTGEWFELQERLKEAGARHVTLILVDTRGEAVDEESPYGPLDTLWRFDMDLIGRGLYPAIDPIGSASVLSEGSYLETAHITIQHKAKKLLRRYRELRSLVQARGVEKLPEAEASIFRTGERLEAFLTQPFYVAEPFTGRPGAGVALEDTLDGVRRILEGATEELEPGQLTYIGRLDASLLRS
jgi:F-type H+-transporting ATPase subunit beta